MAPARCWAGTIEGRVATFATSSQCCLRRDQLLIAGMQRNVEWNPDVTVTVGHNRGRLITSRLDKTLLS